MATLAAIADGNFTTLGTWAVCDAASESDSEADSASTSTAYGDSSTFTPTADDYLGIMLRIAYVNSWSGTITVCLQDSGGADIAGTTVTINVSDIPNLGTVSHSGGFGWYYFKFASAVTLAAATTNVSVKTSVNASVRVYSSSGNNWARQLVRQETPGSLAAGDKFIVTGAWTAAATKTNVTVTMDNTASTVWGALSIGSYGTVTFGSAASTNYLFVCGGSVLDAGRRGVDVHGNGTLNMGTVATPIPTTSTATLQFDMSANVDIGLEIRGYGTWVAQGEGGTAKLAKCYLKADAAVSATSLTTGDSAGADVNTGWKSGDLIGIGTTTITNTQCETRTLTGDASGTTITVAALTNAHNGSDERRCRVINLTRNVKVYGESASMQGYVTLGTWLTSVNLDSVEFKWIGSAVTSPAKRGITIASNNTSSVAMNNIAIYDFAVAGSYGIEVTSNNGTAIAIDDVVMYGVGSSTTASRGLSIVATTGVNSYKNIVVMNQLGNAASTSAVVLGDAGSTYENIEVVGSYGTGSSLQLNETAGRLGSYSGLSACGTTAATGVAILGVRDGTVSNVKAWHSNGSIGGVAIGNTVGVVVDGITVFGTAGGINLGSSVYANNLDLVVKNFDLRAGYSPTLQTIGITLGYSGTRNVLFANGTLGGSSQTHSTADVNVQTNTLPHQVTFDNTTFNSTTEVAWSSTMMGSTGYLVSRNHDNVAGEYREWKYGGRTGGAASILNDTTIYKTASPSLRMYPYSTSVKLTTPDFVVPVASGRTVTVSVWVRKQATADGGGDYDGAPPRLIMRADYLAGFTTDTTCATAAAAVGTWEKLTYTTSAVAHDCVLRFYVDTGGSAAGRFINVDDWDAGIPVDTRGTKYWDVDGSLTLPYSTVYYPIRKANTVMKM